MRIEERPTRRNRSETIRIAVGCHAEHQTGLEFQSLH